MSEHNPTAADRLSALLNGPPTSSHARIQEAIYWPNGDGYGMASKCATMIQAAARVGESARMGYGADRDGRPHHRIHVTRVTVETWEVPADLSEALRREAKVDA